LQVLCWQWQATGWLVLRHAAAEMTEKNVEIDALLARLASERARIEGYARAQGRFVGNIAHEVKTPLTLVLSQIDLLTTSLHRSCHRAALRQEHCLGHSAPFRPRRQLPAARAPVRAG
jgi:signal transduction histidine kinase